MHMYIPHDHSVLMLNQNYCHFCLERIGTSLNVTRLNRKFCCGSQDQVCSHPWYKPNQGHPLCIAVYWKKGKSGFPIVAFPNFTVVLYCAYICINHLLPVSQSTPTNQTNLMQILEAKEGMISYCSTRWLIWLEHVHLINLPNG